MRLSNWVGLQSSEGSVGETHFQAHSHMAVARRSSFLTTQASPRAKWPHAWQLASSEWWSERRREPKAEARASIAFTAFFSITHWAQHNVGGCSVYPGRGDCRRPPGGCLPPHPRIKVLHRNTECPGGLWAAVRQTHKILIMPDFWGSPGEPDGRPTGIVNRNKRPLFHLFIECRLGDYLHQK